MPVSVETGTRRAAGQHARSRARRLAWLRFLGGRFKRDHGTWSQGAEGEEVVGRILEGLAAEGWHVIHDVSFGRGNIDHVVVGPGGIFTVETKSHRGKIFLDIPARMLAGFFAHRRPTMSVEEAAAIYGRLALAVGQSPNLSMSPYTGV